MRKHNYSTLSEEIGWAIGLLPRSQFSVVDVSVHVDKRWSVQYLDKYYAWFSLLLILLMYTEVYVLGV